MADRLRIGVAGLGLIGGSLAKAFRRAFPDAWIAGLDRKPDVLARAKAGSWSFGQALAQFIFPPLGEGMARIPEVVEALKRVGYDGWYVIEQDTSPDPTAVARSNRLYLEGLLA